MRIPSEMMWLGYLLVLLVLATANAAGYRYGVADQAFYIPSILDSLHPGLFPRDAPLLRAQDTLMISDELTAWVVRLGVPLPFLLFGGYVASLLLLLGAALVMARSYYAHAWSAAAFCAALTLRHRITKTGANSFEGYSHPRVAAFACGVVAAAALARDRIGLAWAAVAVACVLHPTTGMWWGVWLLAATWVVRPRWRRALALTTAAAALASAWTLLWGPFSARLTVMDDVWVSVLSGKDYVFPTQWAASVWALNFGTAAVAGTAWWLRSRHGIARPWEAGAVCGIAALLAVFLVSLPFSHARVALAVQLQTSRVFWLIDFLAVAGAVWLAAEAGRRPSHREADRAGSRWRAWRPAVTCMVVVLASAARGVYILAVEHPDRALVQFDIARDAWHDVGRWAATSTPLDAHLLADPDHDWKHGHSLRILAQRDVLVEGVKDPAVSMYSRDVAMRVRERLDAIGDFSTVDAPRALALAQRFDLHYLVIDRPLPLPEEYRNSEFYVYRLH